MVVVEGVRLWGVLGLVIAAGAQVNLDLPLKIKRGTSCDLEPRTLSTFFFHCLGIL